MSIDIIGLLIKDITDMPGSLAGAQVCPMEDGHYSVTVHPFFLGELINIKLWIVRRNRSAWLRRRGPRRPAKFRKI